MHQFKHGIAAVILALSFAVSSAAAGPVEYAGPAQKKTASRSKPAPKSTPAPVVTGTVEDGEAAYESGDYATALQIWRPIAERGDARAQFDLGVLYNNGRGVAQDYVIAHKWFSLAAAQGDERAAEYRDVVAGSIVPKQEPTVEQGEAAYESGDYATALQIWRPLGEKGDARAQYSLGIMYNNGRGVPKDSTRAYMWFSLSAAHGNQTAAEYREIVGRDMSKAQVAAAQKLARDWTNADAPPKPTPRKPRSEKLATGSPR
jgi:TPR repeat protein